MASTSSEVFLKLPAVAVTDGGPFFKNFSSMDLRLSTFNSSLRDTVPPFVTMARAGFFSTGIHDITMCYFCGLCLTNWNPIDSPWLEHQLYNPACAHLLLNKSGAWSNVKHDFFKMVFIFFNDFTLHYLRQA